MNNAALKLAVDICADFEGFRSFPYPDPASDLAKATPRVKWGFSPLVELRSKLPQATQALSGAPYTIGYGQTGPSVAPGTPAMTEPKARALLEREVAKRLDAVTDRSSVDLTTGQLASLASFLFNVGPGKYGVKDGLFELKSARRPSTLWVLSQKGDHRGAAEQFQFWARAQGAVMPGLLRRRKAERALYLRAP